MYTILAKEIANVDQALFSRVGRVDSDYIRAVPVVDQSFSIKGVASHFTDGIGEVQNTLHLTWEVDPGYLEWRDAMIPGLVYSYKDQLYVELKYKWNIGMLNLYVYFLVPVEDCEFAQIDRIDVSAETRTQLDTSAVSFDEIRASEYFKVVQDG